MNIKKGDPCKTFGRVPAYSNYCVNVIYYNVYFYLFIYYFYLIRVCFVCVCVYVKNNGQNLNIFFWFEDSTYIFFNAYYFYYQRK